MYKTQEGISKLNGLRKTLFLEKIYLFKQRKLQSLQHFDMLLDDLVIDPALFLTEFLYQTDI